MIKLEQHKSNYVVNLLHIYLRTFFFLVLVFLFQNNVPNCHRYLNLLIFSIESFIYEYVFVVTKPQVMELLYWGAVKHSLIRKCSTRLLWVSILVPLNKFMHGRVVLMSGNYQEPSQNIMNWFVVTNLLKTWHSGKFSSIN